MRDPGDKLYVIVDIFAPHQRREVRDRCADNEVELVFLPTYSAWRNGIESKFVALRYVALNGTDRRSHAEQASGQEMLFDTWRSHAFFTTTTSAEDLDAVAADKTPAATPSSNKSTSTSRAPRWPTYPRGSSPPTQPGSPWR